MENKTALTELIERLFVEMCKRSDYDIGDAHGLATELLEKEKQQIVDAWLDGGATLGAKNAEQYFTQTYKQ